MRQKYLKTYPFHISAAKAEAERAKGQDRKPKPRPKPEAPRTSDDDLKLKQKEVGEKQEYAKKKSAEYSEKADKAARAYADAQEAGRDAARAKIEAQEAEDDARRAYAEFEKLEQAREWAEYEKATKEREWEEWGEFEKAEEARVKRWDEIADKEAARVQEAIRKRCEYEDWSTAHSIRINEILSQERELNQEIDALEQQIRVSRFTHPNYHARYTHLKQDIRLTIPERTLDDKHEAVSGLHGCHAAKGIRTVRLREMQTRRARLEEESLTRQQLEASRMRQDERLRAANKSLRKEKEAADARAEARRRQRYACHRGFKQCQHDCHWAPSAGGPCWQCSACLHVSFGCERCGKRLCPRCWAEMD